MKKEPKVPTPSQVRRMVEKAKRDHRRELKEAAEHEFGKEKAREMFGPGKGCVGC